MEEKAKFCKHCVVVNDNPIRMKLSPWSHFSGPFLGHTRLIIIDSYSKEHTIDIFKQVTSDEFKEHCKKLGIKHAFSAPKHPATNGAAEGLVKEFKRKIKAI